MYLIFDTIYIYIYVINLYICSQAFDRYINIMFFAGYPAEQNNNLNVITGIEITVDQDVPLAFEVCENYTLTVPASGVAKIHAVTQWGVLRALETFAQLFIWGGNHVATVYSSDMLPVYIEDYPRWAWRGVLIDSSRHYLTTSAIKLTLDAMSYNKLNT